MALQASAEISKLDNMQASVTKTATEDPVVEEEVVEEEVVEEEDDLFEIEIDEEDEQDEQDLENAQILQAIDGDVDPHRVLSQSVRTTQRSSLAKWHRVGYL